MGWEGRETVDWRDWVWRACKWCMCVVICRMLRHDEKLVAVRLFAALLMLNVGRDWVIYEEVLLQERGVRLTYRGAFFASPSVS